MATTTRKPRARRPRTTGPEVARFFERYLKHRKGPMAGKPFVLERFQRRFLDEFYELNAKGDRVYKYGYLGVPRGNGKTPLVAGGGLLELLMRTDSPDVFAIAGARDQARLLIDNARGFVEDDPDLERWVMPSRNFLRSHENNGIMRVLASDGALLHGLIPSAVLVDELHALLLPQHEEAWAAMLTGLHKRPDSFLWVITTAGFRKSSILGRAYEQALLFPDAEDEDGGCLRIRRDRDNGVLFYWYGLPESLSDEWQDEKLWRKVNPASWVTVESLKKQLHAPGFHELDFKRLHLNAWTAVRDSWLPAGTWAGLRSEREIPTGAAVHAAVDVGFTHDTTAVSWAWRDPEDGRVIVRAHVWAVLPQLPHHVYVPGGRMRLELVGEFLRELSERYQVLEVVYDPALFAGEAERISESGIAEMYELPQGGAAIQGAYQGFYQLCREGMLLHDNDPVLAAHVEATAADLTERGWRPRKLRSSQVIDACLTTAWASWRAVHAEQASIYETEDLFAVEVPFDDEDDDDEE